MYVEGCGDESVRLWAMGLYSVGSVGGGFLLKGLLRGTETGKGGTTRLYFRVRMEETKDIMTTN